MKPSWDDAPPWAQYLSWNKCMDGSPHWEWHENEPRLIKNPDVWVSQGKHMIAYPAPRNYNGFERRPSE